MGFSKRGKTYIGVDGPDNRRGEESETLDRKTAEHEADGRGGRDRVDGSLDHLGLADLVQDDGSADSLFFQAVGGDLTLLGTQKAGRLGSISQED